MTEVLVIPSPFGLALHVPDLHQVRTAPAVKASFDEVSCATAACCGMRPQGRAQMKPWPSSQGSRAQAMLRSNPLARLCCCSMHTPDWTSTRSAPGTGCSGSHPPRRWAVRCFLLPLICSSTSKPAWSKAAAYKGFWSLTKPLNLWPP